MGVRTNAVSGGAILDNVLSVALVAGAALLLVRGGGSLLHRLGLDWPGWRGPALTLLATVPCWVALGLQGDLSPDLSLLSLVMLAGVFPLAEEVAFRGFGFVFLRRYLRWPWAAAVLVQALAFGMVHWLGMGGVDGGGMALQVFAMTALGGVVFAWLDSLDGNTIWSGLVLHVSLNAAWSVFVLPDSAVFGWVGNSLRLLSAALAVLFLWLLGRKAARRQSQVGVA